MKYKNFFCLPAAEADYICALAQIVGVSPDELLRRVIRLWAKERPEIARDVWARAQADGRGPWKKPS